MKRTESHLKNVALPIPTTKGIEGWTSKVDDGYLIKCSLVVGHPLNYAPLTETYDLLEVPEDLKNGKIILLKSEKQVFKRLLDDLTKIEVRLVPIFSVYNLIAHNQTSKINNSLFESALTNLFQLLTIESSFRKSESSRKDIEKIFDLVKQLDLSKDQSEKIILFDKIINRIHFDPDLLRHIPGAKQLYCATLINNYLSLLRYGSIKNLLREMEDYFLVKNLNKYISLSNV